MSGFSFLKRGRQKSLKDEDSSQIEPFVPSAVPRNSSGRKKEEADPILPQKKRARRRLVGAVVLVITAIVVLPMIFDAEPQQVRQDMAIEIPSKDKGNKKTGDNKLMDPALAKKADTSANAPETPRKAEAAPPKEVEQPAQTQQSSAAPAKPQDTPSKTDTGKTSADPIGDVIASKTGQGKTDSKTTGKEGNFIIQVAALTSQQKVHELQEKLSKEGIKSKTQKVKAGSSERIRVRIGPLSSKQEVDNTCAKLRKMNLPCNLVSN